MLQMGGGKYSTLTGAPELEVALYILLAIISILFYEKKIKSITFHPVDSQRFQNVRKSFCLTCITGQFRNKFMHSVLYFNIQFRENVVCST